jgi:hypothetical protein
MGHRMIYKTLNLIACCAFLAAAFPFDAVATNPRKALKRAANTAEFADHIEDGIQISRTVDRAKDIADDDRELEDRAKDRLDHKAKRFDMSDGIDEEDVRDRFADTVEKEIAQEVIGNQGRKAIRRKVGP